jgi:hypothetical protein
MVSIVKLPARFSTEQNLQQNFPEVTKDLKHNFMLYFVNWILTLDSHTSDKFFEVSENQVL